MSKDAASLLMQAGATAVPGDAELFELDMSSLALNSIFGNVLSDKAQVKVLSEHAFCFDSPAELKALGPLWVENIEHKKELVSMLQDALRRLKKNIQDQAAQLLAWGLVEAQLLPPEPHAQAVFIHEGVRLTYKIMGENKLCLTWVNGKAAKDPAPVIEVPQYQPNITIAEMAAGHAQSFVSDGPSKEPAALSNDLQERVGQLEIRLEALLKETAEISEALGGIKKRLAEDENHQEVTSETPMAISIPIHVPIPSAPSQEEKKDSAKNDDAELPVVIATEDLVPVESQEEDIVPPASEEFEEDPKTIAMDMFDASNGPSDLISLQAEDTDGSGLAPSFDENPPSPPSSKEISSFEDPATVAMDLVMSNLASGFDEGSSIKSTSVSSSEMLANTDQSPASAIPGSVGTKEDPVNETEDQELAALFAEAQEPEAGILDPSDIGDPFMESDRVHEVVLSEEEEDELDVDGDFLAPQTEAYVLGSADSAILASEPQVDSELSPLENESPDSLTPAEFPEDPLAGIVPEELASLETSAPTAISPPKEKETAFMVDDVFREDEEDEPKIALILRHEKARVKLTQKLNVELPKLVGIETVKQVEEALENETLQILIYIRPPKELIEEMITLKEDYPAIKILVVTNDNAFGDVPEVDLMLPLVNQVSQVAKSILENLDLL